MCLRRMAYAAAIALAAILLSWAASAEPGRGSRARLLATGFGPFGGRRANGSWIAAEAAATAPGLDAEAIEVPVAWGEPARRLGPRCADNPPAAIIAMGEGFPLFFAIEAVARNRRRPLADAKGELPPAGSIESGGPGELRAPGDPVDLAKKLTERGFATHVSTDAGGYLCEEMLYTCLRLQARHRAIRTVVFAHVPPLGSTVYQGGRFVKCDEKILQDFGQALAELVAGVGD